MKTLLFCGAAALTLVTSAVQAGGLAPTVEQAPIVITEDDPSSSADIIVPLLFIALIALAASSGGGNDSGDVVTDLARFQ